MPLNPKKVKDKRESLKLTQREAAELADMTQPAWARIEMGKRTNPSLETAEKVARVLRCPIDRLLSNPEGN